jgi:hypothetical protein
MSLRDFYIYSVLMFGIFFPLFTIQPSRPSFETMSQIYQVCQFLYVLILIAACTGLGSKVDALGFPRKKSDQIFDTNDPPYLNEQNCDTS